MKNFVHSAENITVTAAAAASSGGGVLVGSLFGIASGDAAIGENLVLATRGVFTMPNRRGPVRTPLFELTLQDDEIKVAEERHYRLVPAKKLDQAAIRDYRE